MTETPYVPFYTSDFLGGTSGMTASTKGVYITLLCLMYEAEGPLKQRWEVLARRCGCTLPAFKKAIEDLVDDEKVDVSKAGIWSEKCEKHIQRRAERRNSAKAAAESRWQKTQQKQSKRDAAAMRTQCQPEPEPEYLRDTNVSLVIPADEISEAVAAYNETASRAGWPKIQRVSPARRAALSARLKDAGGVDGWRSALDRAANSAFLTGRNDRGWRADFDFLCKSQKFTKLQEGAYDDRNKSNSKDGSAADMAERVGREWAARFMDSGQGNGTA